MSDERHENDASLAAIADARRAAADRLITPWWYHPTMGVLFAIYTVAVALGDKLVMLAGVLLFFGGLWLLMNAYRRTTGVWMWGYQESAATPLAYAMGAIAGVGVAGALILSSLDVADGWVYAIAVALGVALVVVGHRYDRVLRADLRGEL
jgi:hypothetical protein